MDSQTTPTLLTLPLSTTLTCIQTTVATVQLLHASYNKQRIRYVSKSSCGQKYPTFAPTDVVWPSFLQLVDGCLENIIQLIEENALIIAGVAIGIAVLEVRSHKPQLAIRLYCALEFPSLHPEITNSRNTHQSNRGEERV